MEHTDQDFNWIGSLLIAHPGLMDPNFRRTVVMMTAFGQHTGAMGVILNRPQDRLLQEVHPQLHGTPLGEIPLYEGGPVQTEEVILAAWRWQEDASTFQLFFGIPMDKLEGLIETHPDLEVRGFAGYSGWSCGQLQAECSEKAWLITPLKPDFVNQPSTQLWRNALVKTQPSLEILANAPDDPSLN